MQGIEAIRVKVFDGGYKPMIYIFEGDDSLQEMIKFFKEKYNLNGDGSDNGTSHEKINKFSRR
jgi:hypothetical protein